MAKALVITHMLQHARDSLFTAEVAKRAEKIVLLSLWGLSVLCGEIWVITGKARTIALSVMQG